MVPDKDDIKETKGMDDFEEIIEGVEVTDNELAKTLVSEGQKGDSDEELEAQMVAALASEQASGEDDLEAQMAAAMAEEVGEGEGAGDDLEAQMAAAMEQDVRMDEDMFDSLPGGDTSSLEVREAGFKQLTPSDEPVGRDNIDRLLDIGLSLSVELGRKDMKIKEILSLGPGKIIELDKLAGEPVDLLVNGKLLAKGEVVVVDENFGVRITELIDPVDRIKILR